MTKDFMDLLRAQFESAILLEEGRPGIFQVFLPIWRSDGDMVPVYLEAIQKDGKPLVRVRDYGGTVMFIFGVDTSSPEGGDLFERAAKFYGLNVDNGELFVDVEPERLLDGVLQLAAASKSINDIGKLELKESREERRGYEQGRA